MKKKTLVFTLALCTLFSFSACSQDNKIDDSLRGTVSTTSIEATEQNSTEADTADGADTAVDNTDATDAVTDDAAGEALTMGHSDNNSYESTFLGIGCKFDSDWTFLTDEQIQANNHLTAELIDNNAISKALENGSVLTDMTVQNTLNGSNVCIAIEKIPSVMKSTTEEQYIDIVITKIVGTMESAGFSNVTTEKFTTTFLGSDHIALKITSTISDTAVTQVQIPIKKGDYMACLTASAFGNDTVDEMLNAFYALD